MSNDSKIPTPEMVRLAIEEGDGMALYKWSVMYSRGKDVLQDDVEALRLCKLAAESWSPDAQQELGDRCFHGRGVSQDLIESYMWYALAAHNKIHMTMGTDEIDITETSWLEKESVKKTLRGLETLRRKLTRAQAKEGGELASEWKKEHPGGPFYADEE